jgi:hypothetical protein
MILMALYDFLARGPKGKCQVLGRMREHPNRLMTIRRESRLSLHYSTCLRAFHVPLESEVLLLRHSIVRTHPKIRTISNLRDIPNTQLFLSLPPATNPDHTGMQCLPLVVG